MPIVTATIADSAPAARAQSCQRLIVGCRIAHSHSPAPTVMRPEVMRTIDTLRFSKACMKGPAAGPTDRAVGATKNPIRIPAPAQKPPATMWMRRSTVTMVLPVVSTKLDRRPGALLVDQDAFDPDTIGS